MKVGNRGQVTIPKVIRDRFGIRPGTEIEFRVVEGSLVLQKKPKKLNLGEWKGRCRSSFSALGYSAVAGMRPLLLLLLAVPLAAQQTPLDRLRASIERITRSVDATWGIYIKCLETGEEIAVDADRRMDTMSVIKIPLMVEVFEQIKAGKFSLADKYTLAKDDILPGTGILRSLDPGPR